MSAQIIQFPAHQPTVSLPELSATMVAAGVALLVALGVLGLALVVVSATRGIGR